jgi:outer membrane protein OmpA-like peptidoglycan-associated protein
MRKVAVLIALGILLGTTPATRAEAQFLTRVKERVKQKAAERKAQTEESVLNRAAEPADSAMAKMTAPVESIAARAGGGAGAAVGRLGRGQRHSEEESRLRQELAAGHAGLPGVKFAAGTDAIDPSSEPSLQSLAVVLTDSPGVFLVHGRADLGASPEAAAQLASARAAAIKGWLVGNGIPAERVFAAGDGAAAPEAPLVSVVPMQ